jgi:hypothetical protein
MKREKDEYSNLIVELYIMIESGSIMVGALGLSQNSVDFIRKEFKKTIKNTNQVRCEKRRNKKRSVNKLKNH